MHTIPNVGKRVVTEPPQPKKKKGKAKRQRHKVGHAVLRSRARFDAAGYIKRKRARSARTGPKNPCVHVTHPTLFQKDSRGRKPLAYEQRMEGVRELQRVMAEAAGAQEKNVRGRTMAAKKRRKTGSPTTTSPVISLVDSPPSGSAVVSPAITVSPSITCAPSSNNPAQPALALPTQMHLMNAQLMQMQMYAQYTQLLYSQLLNSVTKHPGS